MLRFLRFTAVFGMSLALTDFVLVLIDIRQYFHNYPPGSLANLKAGAHHLLQSGLYGPCAWFGFAAMLYVMVDLAGGKRKQVGSASDLEPPHGRIAA